MSAVTFDEALKNGCGFIISPGCKTENKGVFTESRVDRTTVPNDWYAYDIRTTDSGNLNVLENIVVVNHGGTFLTKTPVKMNVNGYRSLSGRGGYTFYRKES